jgi:hypothetical protein
MPLFDTMTGRATQSVLNEWTVEHPELDQQIRLLLDVVKQLDARTSSPFFAMIYEDYPFRLFISGAASTAAELWMSFFERRLAKDGLPELHYRLQLKTEGKALSEDFRSHSAADTASKIIGALELV